MEALIKSLPAKLVPDSLAARFVLLLAGALLAANFVAFVLLAAEGRRFDRAAQDAREVERAVTLVAALESVEPQVWRAITRRATNRFTRVEIDDQPLVSQTGSDQRAAQLAVALREVMPARMVHVAMVPRSFLRQEPAANPARIRPEGRAGALAFSVQLNTQGRNDTWLNIASYEPLRNSGPGFEVLLMTLGLSLAAVLGVGLLFVRQMVRPLAALADAAQAAGRGDHSARVPVEGAREFRKAGAAFNDMQAKIAGFDAERMRTLGAVGHDLRTPITGLRIRAEMLDDAGVREAFVRTLDDMTVMANGLVTFAKGTGEAENPLVLDLTAFLAQLCQTRGATFGGGGPAQVKARPVALGRAVGNVIDNALRYAGSATVRLETKSHDVMPHVMIVIEDDGPGIAAERLEAMFEPFARGEESRNLETGGAGLGLSIARTIVQAHGGSIRLENRTPKGLRAIITLPMV